MEGVVEIRMNCCQFYFETEVRLPKYTGSIQKPRPLPQVLNADFLVSRGDDKVTVFFIYCEMFSQARE